MHDSDVLDTADFYMLADAWLIAPPDDPSLRQYLIDSEWLDPDFADEVIAKMRELDAAREPGWDRLTS